MKVVPFLFVENSKGKPDGMWTLVLISFFMCVGTIGYTVLAGFQEWPPSAGAMDSALMLFGACTAIYWGRKNSDARHPGGLAGPPVAASAPDEAYDPEVG